MRTMPRVQHRPRRHVALALAVALGLGVTAGLAARAADAPAMADPAALVVRPDQGLTLGGTRVTIEVADLSAATFEQVAAGISFTLALAKDGTLYAWGRHNLGQLGSGAATTSSPQRATKVDMTGVLAGKKIVQVAAGGESAAVLTDDGRVYTWGTNSSGKLGTGSDETALQWSTDPRAVSVSGALAGKHIKQISVGDYHMTALDNNGRLYAWGDGKYGQLGNNDAASSAVPVAVSTSGVLGGVVLTEASASRANTVALGSNGKIYAWGRNADGQLGTGSKANVDALVPVETNMSGALAGKTVTAVITLDNTMLAIADGQVFGWGRNYYGELGTGDQTEHLNPHPVDTSGALAGVEIVQIAGFRSTVMARDSAGAAYGWGNNVNGVLGGGGAAGDYVRMPAAVDRSGVLADKDVVALVTSGYHSVALDPAGQAFTWGQGQALGDASTYHSSSPLAVPTHRVRFGTGSLGTNVVMDVAHGTVEATTPRHAAGDADVLVVPIAG